MLYRLIKIIVIPLLFILNLNAQDKLDIQNEEFMPFHTKILWGEKGLIRKMNLAPETRRDELKLRSKMLQNQVNTEKDEKRIRAYPQMKNSFLRVAGHQKHIKNYPKRDKP